MANVIVGTQGNDNPLLGTDQPELILGLGGDDVIVSGAGSDTIDGGPGFDLLSLWPDFTTGGARINMGQGTVESLTGGPDVDIFMSIEGIIATNFSDIYDASGFGFTAGNRNVGDFGSFNQIFPLRGDDIITGNGNTIVRLDNRNETSSVTVNLREGWARSDYLGTKTILGGVRGVQGTQFDDFIVLGNPANDFLERYWATAGSDTIDGGSGYDRVEYNRGRLTATGLNIDLGNGIVTGKFNGAVDVLRNIESIVGTNEADVFDARQYSLNSPNAAGGFSRFMPLINDFEGRGGDDTIYGNGFTVLRYVSALSGVEVNLRTGIAKSIGPNDAAGIGVDTFSGVYGVIGSNHADRLIGGNPLNDEYESFRPLGGNDTIDGGGGWDVVVLQHNTGWIIYDNQIMFEVDADGNRLYNKGVTINLAAGTAGDNDAVGMNTLRGIESIRGTMYDDIYDARGFSETSANAGSFGTLNSFEGRYGNDIIIGNGNTRIDFILAYAPVTVDFVQARATSSQYLIDGSDPALVGVDTFSGVNAVRGSDYGDTFIGSSAREIFFGAGGNDTIFGGAGSDLAVYQGNREQYVVSKSLDSSGNTVLSVIDLVTDRDDRDTLVNVTRLQFADQTVAFDIGEADTASQAYRIYKAAFNRTPDLPGLGYWIEQMDNGAELMAVAGGFLGSSEFIQKNGPNLSDADFINAMYLNVLGRGADQGGYDYWFEQIGNGLQRAHILTYFSESIENINNVAGLIANGIAYDPLDPYPTQGLYLS